ncbi:MAG: AAA family ATPase [Firmicutes bacterium]|nr:AAA family ATPase [Bacillota bacterium]MCL5040517.1 AAA family ATPase [Bacillota bacterium]
MRGGLKKVLRDGQIQLGEKLNEEQLLKRKVVSLFTLLSNLFGADRLVLKAGKLEVLEAMRSSNLPERVHALQKLVFENPALAGPPSPPDIPRILEGVEEEIADLIARRSIEDQLEKRVAEKMQERHEEYLKEIKSQLVKEATGPENAQTLKRFALLEKLERRKLTKNPLDLLRPTSLKEVVGQERGMRALLAKIASPFPQHVLLYGPPGVGKTTVARLVLEEARRFPRSPFGKDAPFVEVDGATLRWDPREVTNPLLGSVHDPIYQGARRDLAEGGIPEPKLGLVTEAHGGVLFIDEVGELDPMLQNKLLKVLEDKRVTFDSAYYDPTDARIPKYIKKLFEEGAPADFILIGATTREPEEINPALRSRCAEIFFDPLEPDQIRAILKTATRKLRVRAQKEAYDLISEYTMEGRKAVGILADAFSLGYQRWTQEQDNPLGGITGKGTAQEAAAQDTFAPAATKGARTQAHPGEAGRQRTTVWAPFVITREDVLEVIQASRLAPSVLTRSSSIPEVGRVFGLGVYGYLGTVLEIEAVAFPSLEKGKGSLRFNEAAGSMARDSVFNAASVIRKTTGLDLTDYDLHVNVVGGGHIDGPSAGLAILMAILSAVQGRPLRQDVAVTGEISIQGKVRPVGGIFEKIYGARQAGMKKVILPRENEKDVPRGVSGIEVVTVSSVEEALGHLSIEETVRAKATGRVSPVIAGEIAL